uniref:Uncharacterized protein n=1 Tax=Triticum urartu TaxID=4572 RepID=A0A8R7PVZ7_TRIUA
MALSFRQLWSVAGRLWRERRASSSTSSIRDALTALRTCASRAMAAFCRAAGSTSDRHHDRPLAKVPVAVSCAFGPWERLGDYMPDAKSNIATPCSVQASKCTIHVPRISTFACLMHAEISKCTTPHGPDVKDK